MGLPLLNLSFLFGNITAKAYSSYPQSQVDVALSEWPSSLGHLTQALRTPCASLQSNG